MRHLFLGVALAALNIADEGGGAPAVVVIPEAGGQVAEAEAAVEIARIEGETRIELAEIDAARDEAAHAANIEASAAFGEALAADINDSLEAEKTEWQIRAETAEAELAALKASSTPPPSPPEPPQSLPPSAAADALASLPVVEPEPPASPPEPPAEPPKRARKHRWI